MTDTYNYDDRAYRGLGDPRGGDYIQGQVFVGMAFDLPTAKSDIYQAISRACKSVDLQARRVDDIQDAGPIPVQILREIENAEFLIFDLSVERPNVYYELDYAHGVGNGPEHIVLIVREGEKIHFDVEHMRFLTYASAIDLEQKLVLRLKAMIERCR